MFQKDQMEIVRLAIEQTYTDRMTVTVMEKTMNQETGETQFKPVEVSKDVPCRLSFGTKSSAAPAGEIPAYTVSQPVKLFVSPDIAIPPGSSVSVTRCGVTKKYRQSGEPALYPTHQEIILELDEAYA